MKSSLREDHVTIVEIAVNLVAYPLTIVEITVNLVEYPFQNVITNYSLCWLFVMFLTNDMFSSMPLLSESVDDGHTVAKDPQTAMFFKQACPQLEPATPVCQRHSRGDFHLSAIKQ